MLDDYLLLDQRAVAEGYRFERERLRSEVAQLGDDDLATESLCTGWRLRDVVAHMTGLVADVLAGDTQGAGQPDATARQVAQRASVPMAELMAEWDAVGEAFAELLRSFDDETWAAPLPSGQTLGEGAERLLEDVWVHAHDILLPVGGSPLDGPGLAATMNVVLHEWPLRVRRLAPDLPGLAVRTGHVALDIGDAEQGPAISGDPALLALVAFDRLTVAEAQRSGRCRIDARVPPDVVGIFGPPVDGSTMLSTPSA
jgi:uncharacterized protein (TIGR03083 family)